MDTSVKKVSPSQKRRIPLMGKIGLVLLALAVALAVGFFAYASDYYHAADSNKSYLVPTAQLAVENEGSSLAFGETTAEIGIVFYPGAKVEYLSYAPLLRELAEQGFFCVVVEMPFNLAFFDIDAARDVMAEYPEVKQWWIGGHSLGGSMAANYCASNADAFEGLILLASYSADDLPSTGLRVHSIYGSKDTVLTIGKLESARTLMPSDYVEHVIEGGNHAYFGNYGEQAGDGTATISHEQQWAETAAIMAEAMEDGGLG